MTLPISKKSFTNPGIEYRGVPFWALNDKLENNELIRQIDEMAAAGMGGFFMHSRIGLRTPYLSREWMDRIATCCNHAKQRGIHAWLYDEDRWPSGFASGTIAASKMDYRANWLTPVEVDIEADLSALFAVYRNTASENEVPHYKLIQASQAGIHDRLLGIRRVFQDNDPWFNGTGYIDTLNPEAVRAFIDSTHELYAERFGSEFGKTIPGLFTDEATLFPVWGNGLSEASIPWTEQLQSAFIDAYGYDLINHLPSLFYDIGNYKLVRYHYRLLISSLFLEAYAKQVYEWCDKNNLKLTGHYLGEDDLVIQTRWIGSCMPLYEYMHIPGIDHLYHGLEPVMLIKQVSSVANQLGKDRILSETFGGTGWNLSFSDQRWMWTWQCALGVNFINQHLALYSSKGCRKRDWPPSIFVQQPYWHLYGQVCEYFARMCALMSSGRYHAEILVLHPIASAWTVYSPCNEQPVKRLSDSFNTLCTKLVSDQWQYDLGNETLMAKYAIVSDGRLVINNMSYSIVVLPDIITISSTTLDILIDFANRGGIVVCSGQPPQLVDGTESPRLFDFLDKHVKKLSSYDELSQLLHESANRLINICNLDGSNCSDAVIHTRRYNGGWTVLIGNKNRDASLSIIVRAKIAGSINILEWNCENGDVIGYPHTSQHGEIEMSLDIAPGGSRLFTFEDTQISEDTTTIVTDRTTETINLPEKWRFEKLDPNVLLLDICDCRIGTSDWECSVPVVELQSRLENLANETFVEMRFEFNLDAAPSSFGQLMLNIEQPEAFEISVNDRGIESSFIDWWIDRSIKQVDISSAIRRGINTIKLKCMFKPPIKPGTQIFTSDGLELDNIYITGNFLVFGKNSSPGPLDTVRLSAPFTLKPDNMAHIDGEITESGFPFYAGRAVLSLSFDYNKNLYDNPVLEIQNMKAAAAEIIVNGERAGMILWPPFTASINNYVRNGMNDLDVVLYSSLRNVFGPHHHKDGDPSIVWLGTFLRNEDWTQDYHSVKFGIDGPARLNVVRKKGRK